MSVTGLSPGPDKMYKISSHRRKNNSGELDVFEAARYFSDDNPGANIPEKIIISENRQHFQRTPQMNLDLPIMIKNQINSPQYHAMDHQKQTKDNKKSKQPSSPGARLASFLNSLLNQTPLKKKKLKPVSTKGFHDEEEENPNGRRKRRISISHFISSSNNSGIKKIPGHANTPTKSCMEYRNLSDQKVEVVNSFPENVGNFKPIFQNEIFGEKRGTDNYAWMEENSIFGNGVLEKSPKNGSFGFSLEEMEFRKFSYDDDDDNSDSSSDLFDLPNHDLDFYSSDLPVYETTHMDKIKIGI
ncbi:hypothetical protein BUALT_Bualt05G0140800 [Buddleja alternifolia]|uniref:Protein BIG GRAIN 1-like E n=1 Tax=Buddleja alternifolia TaxID=168488 RepID=A0AAV6XQT4_9LAMI|nr:hypothetical protein BUALT_Bualt05G0140800 [Buddleja alternifolia]